MSIYALGVTGRFGLGHGLLAWARSVVWARQNGASVINPNWLQVRVGPYLRNERDKRFYFKLFRSGNQVGGVQKLRLLLRARRVRIEDWTDEHRKAATNRDMVVEFHNAVGDNEKIFFHEIHGHQDLVRSALMDMTKSKYLPATSELPHIAVHIRGGDFAAPKSNDQLTSGGQNLRIPVSWYAEMITGIRSISSFQVPVIVYSDCADNEISEVLKLSHTVRSNQTESITDMLAIANATLLVSSGSGFSRWGSYLGQVPRICFPGQRGVRVLVQESSEVDMEPEAHSSEELNNAFKMLIYNRVHLSVVKKL
jgi:hypothetical protein